MVVVHSAGCTAGRYIVTLASFEALNGRRWELIVLLVQPLSWEISGLYFSKLVLGGLA